MNQAKDDAKSQELEKKNREMMEQMAAMAERLKMFEKKNWTKVCQLGYKSAIFQYLFNDLFN